MCIRDSRESDEALTRTYTPFLEPLTQISEKLNVSGDKIKKINVEDEDTKTAVEMTPPPPSQTRFLRTEVLAPVSYTHLDVYKRQE